MISITAGHEIKSEARQQPYLSFQPCDLPQHNDLNRDHPSLTTLCLVIPIWAVAVSVAHPVLGNAAHAIEGRLAGERVGRAFSWNTQNKGRFTTRL